MKLTILQENLSNCLSITSHFVSSHPQLPILSNFLLVAKKNRFKISATNLEMGINCYSGAKIEKEGKTTVLARPFLEFISSLPADKTNLELKKGNFEVSCGRFKATFPTTLPTDFPHIPIRSSEKLTLPLSLFLEAITEVIFAASIDESRPILEGVCFQFKGKECQLEATDGYRLSQKKLILKKEQKQMKFILPASVLNEIIKLKPKGELLEMGLSNKEKQAVFFFPNIEIASRLLEGEFPNIEQVIPQSKETTILVNREEFQNAVRLASIFARESANIIKMEVVGGAIKVSANSPQVGENQSSVEADIKGKPQKVAFNFRFLLDFFQAINKKQISIELNGSLDPVVFKIPNDKSFLHVIMPVRLQEEEK